MSVSTESGEAPSAVETGPAVPTGTSAGRPAPETRGDSKLIVVLIHLPVMARDYVRFGLGYMAKRGCRVKVLDVADVLFPMLRHERGHYTQYRDIELEVVQGAWRAEDYERAVKNAWLAVPLVSYGPRSHDLFVGLSRSGTPYLDVRNCPLPVEPAAGVSGGHRTVSAPDIPDGLRPADYVVYAGWKSIEQEFPVGPTTRAIWAHSQDYEAFRSCLQDPAGSLTEAVFLDEFLPSHPDLTALGLRLDIRPQEYYAALRSFLDMVESRLGLRVVVAADPKGEYRAREDWFGGREVVFNATPRLVRQARLVLAHRSTAIGCAVMARKPVLLFTTRYLHRTHHRRYLDGFARALGKRLWYMEDPQSIEWDDVFNVDQEAYARFMRDYVKTEESPDLPLWEIVFNVLARESAQTTGKRVLEVNHEYLVC
ncbi:MAG: hypothetical protein HYY13_01795 [Nitrospirae bacterium]|nr:hypothetical protein [Nitrospirota bacterium]